MNRAENRIQTMITRGELETVDDSAEVQLVKLSGRDGEIIDEVEHVQGYGVTVNPPKGAGVLLLSIGGSQDDPVTSAIDAAEFRVKGLESGEVAIYDQTGTVILLKSSGDVEIQPSSGVVKVTGDLEASGDLKDASGTLDELRQEFINFVDLTYGVHVHVCAAPGNPSGPPQAPEVP